MQLRNVLLKVPEYMNTLVESMWDFVKHIFLHRRNLRNG